MKRLIIAEKPSVARAIAESLGIVKSDKGYIECNNDTVVTWCFGHMYQLVMPDFYISDNITRSNNGLKKWRFEDLPILPSEWKLEESEISSFLKCKILNLNILVLNVAKLYIKEKVRKRKVSFIGVVLVIKMDVIRFFMIITASLNFKKDKVKYEKK